MRPCPDLVPSRSWTPDDLPGLAELLLAARAAGTVDAYPSVAELRLLLTDPGPAEAAVWPTASAGGSPGAFSEGERRRRPG